jgi:hypothetical protein
VLRNNDSAIDSRILDATGAELLPLLEEYTRKLRMRLGDLHREETDGLQMAFQETVLNGLHAARALARSRGRHEHDTRIIDVELVMATLDAAKVLFQKLAIQDARRQRDPSRRVTPPSSGPPPPRGSFNGGRRAPPAPPEPRRDPWEQSAERKTPTFGDDASAQDARAQALDRRARSRDRKR